MVGFPSPPQGWAIPIEKYSPGVTAGLACGQGGLFSRGFQGMSAVRPHPHQRQPQRRTSSAGGVAPTQRYCSLLAYKQKQKKPKQKGKRLFGVGWVAAAVWAALACLLQALQAELSSSWMAACCSGLSCAMHSVHSPPEV